VGVAAGAGSGIVDGPGVVASGSGGGVGSSARATDDSPAIATTASPNLRMARSSAGTRVAASIDFLVAANRNAIPEVQDRHGDTCVCVDDMIDRMRAAMVIALLAWSAPADAAMMEHFDLEGLVLRSSAVVIAHRTSHASRTGMSHYTVVKTLRGTV